MKAFKPRPGSVTAASQKPAPFFNKEDGKSSPENAVNGNGQFFGEQSSFFSTGDHHGVQAKLAIGKPNDEYEQEADATADKVVQRLATPGVQAGNERAIRPEPVALQTKPFAQRACAVCGKEEGLQRASSSDPSSSVETALSSSKGDGSPLPADTRTKMENAFNRDFSDVRIHEGSSAVQMSKELNAQAFTHGSDIYFNSGKYDTHTSGGKHLLAHELTHVAQQNGKKQNGPQTKKFPQDNSRVLTAQRQPDDAAVSPGDLPAEAMPDYSSWSYYQLRDAYLSYQATPGAGDPDRDTFEAVRLAFTNSIRETLAQGRQGRLKAGTDLSILDLSLAEAKLNDIEEKYFLVDELLLDTGMMELVKLKVEAAAARAAKQNEEYRPKGLDTSGDYTVMEFLDVFNDLSEADRWLELYAFDQQKAEAKAYVLRLREELRSKVASDLPLELFTASLDAGNPFITGLDNGKTLEYIYTIENILYTAGGFEDFAQKHAAASTAVDSLTYRLLGNNDYYKGVLKNSLQVLHFHLSITGGASGYHTIAGAGIGNVPGGTGQIATDPVGIRHQLTEIWKNFYYYHSFSAPGSITLYAGDIIVKPLAAQIRKGNSPPGVDPEWLSNQILFQWSLIAEEENELISSFSEAVKTQTIEILDASEKKIRTEAERLNIVISDDWILPYVSSMETNEFELAGIAEAAKQLAVVKSEIAAIDYSLFQEKTDLSGMVFKGLASIVAESDRLDAPDQLRAQASLYVTYKQEELVKKQELKKNKELKYNILRKELETSYPSLATWASRDDTGGLADLSSGGDITKNMLAQDLLSKLWNIRKVRAELGDDISVWELHEIIPAAKLKMMIIPGSFYDYVIETKIKREREDKEFWETFKLVVGLGLAVLSFGSLSGPAAALVIAARAGSIAMDVYEAYGAFKEYDIQKAMASTDFDAASSLAHDDPSMLGLAVSIVALVADVKDAAEIFDGARALLKRNLNKDNFLKLVDDLPTNGLKDAAAKKEFAAVMEAEHEAKALSGKVDQKVEQALEGNAAKIDVDANTGAGPGKLFATKAGTVYRCSSPCQQLWLFFEKELRSNDILATRLKNIEAGIKAANGIVTPQLQQSVKNLNEVLNANKYFGTNATSILDYTDPLVRHDPPLGGSIVYRDAGGTVGMVKKIDDDTLEISTKLGQTTVRKDLQNWLKVTPGQLNLPSGRKGFERLHASGKIIGHESPFGIYFGPYWVNHFLQSDGIEDLLRMARIDPAGAPKISIIVKKKTLPVVDKSNIVETAEFLDTITYRVGTTDVMLQVVEPHNPLSDVIVEITTPSGSSSVKMLESDYPD